MIQSDIVSHPRGLSVVHLYHACRAQPSNTLYEIPSLSCRTCREALGPDRILPERPPGESMFQGIVLYFTAGFQLKQRGKAKTCAIRHCYRCCMTCFLLTPRGQLVGLCWDRASIPEMNDVSRCHLVTALLPNLSAPSAFVLRFGPLPDSHLVTVNDSTIVR